VKRCGNAARHWDRRHELTKLIENSPVHSANKRQMTLAAANHRLIVLSIWWFNFKRAFVKQSN